MSITQFTMEDVRCFAERQTLEVRPLTFLVGENSTGKTTALACFHVLVNILQGKGVDFDAKTTDSHPYSMGTFKEIVRNSRKKEKKFKLGFAYKYGNENIEWIVEFIERKGRSEPTISLISIKFLDGEVVFKIADDLQGTMRLVTFETKKNRYQLDCKPDLLTRFPMRFFLDRLSISSETLLDGVSEGNKALEKYLRTKANSFNVEYNPWDIWNSFSIFSTTPIRSRPERTYDPIKEFDDPEGSDVPMLLMRLEANQKKEWEALKEQLVEFGKRSGLFQDIKIKNYGRSFGEPFQLQFKVRGPTTNIIDVGYGVSQIFPVLVQIIYPIISHTTQDNGSVLTISLLQQPEVHLHPKAQAEFSSLLAKYASQGNRSFIVETHSDYMIDRARIEIRNGNIQPENVSLIYFEPKGNIVKVHNISFDKMANMKGVPPHFRDFFLKETDRLMGFED